MKQVVNFRDTIIVSNSSFVTAASSRLYKFFYGQEIYLFTHPVQAKNRENFWNYFTPENAFSGK